MAEKLTPNEACCWQGELWQRSLRRMRFVAGRVAVAKRLVRGAAVAERHRENVASQGAVAKRLAGCAR